LIYEETSGIVFIRVY